ncbi:MAG TPA: chemotaxis protein CheA, partial [Arenimonas sp.]|nr:chemotaxis protein CheA [Arenimonas sp.]
GSGGSKVGELAIETRAVHPQVVEAALKKQGEARKRQAQEAQLLRVQAGKLDALIDRVGELVIASAGVGQVANRLGDAELHESISAMSRLIEDLRDGAMRLRMVEIGETFNRFRRIVRDVAQQLGKDIELTISGADTELDKSLVEQIADPLTHLVRNAIDHGIESSEQRLASGKPARGHIRLDAHHEAGNVIIEVSDDGGGLKREAILAKARQKGLVAADANPPDSEVWQLIFEPGFSTAQQVSDLSGRGVGMDVVRRNIEALRGSIEIESKPGQGSSFRICLPLTLAIIGGFLVRVADSHYVVPLDTVIECVDVASEAMDKGYVELRGEALPLLSLRRHFGLRGTTARRESILVVASGRRRAGLLVDHLEGELQAVIKPLGQLFARLSGIAGSTILGSGEVALVLDVPLLLADATRRESSAARLASTRPPD